MAIGPALEVLDRLLLGQTSFHRRPDAWDVLDANGRVAAVLCPRQSGFVSISPCRDRPLPELSGKQIVPYGESVELRIYPENIAEGIARVRELVDPAVR